MAELYGYLAEFDDSDLLLRAIQATRARGIRRFDAFTPFPIAAVVDAVGQRSRPVVGFGVAGACIGAALGLAMQILLTRDYPLNTGGRPLLAYTAFSVIGFEFAVLFAVFFAIAGMLWLNGLPRLHHPVFEGRRFDLAAADRFFLCIEAHGGLDHEATVEFLDGLGARSIERLQT